MDLFFQLTAVNLAVTIISIVAAFHVGKRRGAVTETLTFGENSFDAIKKFMEV